MIDKPRFKFRICYTAQNGEKRMVYDDNRFLIDMNGRVFENYGKSFAKPMWEEPFDSAEPPILQQFTGAADKNGRLIYGGDVVKCKRFYLKPLIEGPKGVFHSQPNDLVETGEELGVVFLSSVTLGWSIAYRRYDDYDDLSHFCAAHRIEVVGNTFENADPIPDWNNNIWPL